MFLSALVPYILGLLATKIKTYRLKSINSKTIQSTKVFEISDVKSPFFKLEDNIK